MVNTDQGISLYEQFFQKIEEKMKENRDLGICKDRVLTNR